jgi:cellulose 1,4-beta-cellobiosidase
VPVTTTTTASALAAPTNLIAATYSRFVALQWRETTPGVTFDLYRGTSSGTETLYASGITRTSYGDGGVVNGTTYYYEVTAVKGGVHSAASNQVSITAK